MRFDTMITCGTIVTADGVLRADIGIKNGKIGAVLSPGGQFQAAERIDASGKYILPGGVDIHVHFEMDAGSIRSTDDFFTGTRAAAFGGTTTVMDFVEPAPEESLPGVHLQDFDTSEYFIDYL